MDFVKELGDNPYFSVKSAFSEVVTAIWALESDIERMEISLKTKACEGVGVGVMVVDVVVEVSGVVVGVGVGVDAG